MPGKQRPRLLEPIGGRRRDLGAGLRQLRQVVGSAPREFVGVGVKVRTRTASVIAATLPPAGLTIFSGHIRLRPSFNRHLLD